MAAAALSLGRLGGRGPPGTSIGKPSSIIEPQSPSIRAEQRVLQFDHAALIVVARVVADADTPLHQFAEVRAAAEIRAHRPVQGTAIFESHRQLTTAVHADQLERETYFRCPGSVRRNQRRPGSTRDVRIRRPGCGASAAARPRPSGRSKFRAGQRWYPAR